MAEDGFRPMKLPKRGTDLLAGHQYVLDPVARTIIEEVYGLRNIPRSVECIQAQVLPKQIDTVTTCLLTGERTCGTPVRIEAKHSTFRIYWKYKSVETFTLDFDKLEELRPFYVDADRVSEIEKQDSSQGVKKSPERKAAQLKENTKKLVDLLNL